MDSKDELLIILLKCGYMDIDKLIEIMEFGEELFNENILYDVIDEHGSEALGSFNDLMYYLMENIVYRLVGILDEEDIEDESHPYWAILADYWEHPYVNYLDSHFQLESLDCRSKGETRDDLLKNLRNELIELRNRKR